MAGAAPADGERDDRGRFRAGNRTSKLGGSPLTKRRRELEEALDAALDVGDLQQLLQALHQQAVDGDTSAAMLLMHYRFGRPRERAAAVDVELPPRLDSAEDIQAALETIARAAAAGRVEPSVCATLAGIVASVADAAILTDLSRRLAMLEGSRASS